MVNTQSGTVLAQAVESTKYPMADKLIALNASNMNEIIVVGGKTQDGKGIIYCLGSDAGLKWSQNYPKPVTTVGVATRGTFVGIGGVDNNLYYFTSHGELAWSDDCRSNVKFLSVSGQGQYVCTGLADGNIKFYDNDIVAARKFVWKHRFDEPVSSLSMNTEGTLVCAGTEEGEVSVFTERGDLAWTKLLEGRINRIKVASEGGAIVVACSDNKLRYYSANIGKTLWSGEGDGVFIDADITQHGDRVVGICKDNFVYFYDKIGNLLWKYDLGNPGEKVVVAKEGKTVVATSIDTNLHCLDAKGNLVWRFRAGGAGVSGLTVSDDGDIVAISCDAGVLLFENLQVIGGILPKIRHAITTAEEQNIPIFKAQKLYEEAVVALNYGDYLTAAEKVRKIEINIGRDDQAKAPAPEREAPPATTDDDERSAIRTKIDTILKKSEALKDKGVNVDPVENLLGEALVLVEEGNPSEAYAFVTDASEILNELLMSVPQDAQDAQEAPKETESPPNNKTVAMESVERATKMLSNLEGTEINLDIIKADIMTATNLIGTAEYQRAIAAANRAVVTMEKALDPYITTCLVNVKKLMKLAEGKGVDTTDPKKMLMATGDAMGRGNYLGALDSVKDAEGWLEEALGPGEQKEPASVEKPAISIPPPPSMSDEAPGAKVPVQGAEKALDETKETPKEGDDGEEPIPKEPLSEDAGKEGPEAEVTEPELVEKPKLVLKEISDGSGDPGTTLQEAEEALRNGDVTGAVEGYILAMEALDGRARMVVEQAIGKAEESIAKIKGDGFDTSDAGSDLESAKSALASGNYVDASKNALQAFEKADTAALAEIKRAIEESRSSIKMATTLGADISAAEDMIRDAEEAISKRDFSVALEFTGKAISEVEKASNDSVIAIVERGKELLAKATEIGADTSEVMEQFDMIGKVMDEKDFTKAHELAKEAVEAAKVLPRSFIQGKISMVRSKVLELEKMGADAMMAKNFMIRARSSMASGDYAAALSACEKCLAETEKAPKILVNRRIAKAKNEVENIKAQGQATDEIDAMISEAEEKAVNGDFDGAKTLADKALASIKEISDLSAEATNSLFDADMCIATAKDAGKDVTRASELFNEAMEARSQDPAKAIELAKQIKQIMDE